VRAELPETAKLAAVAPPTNTDVPVTFKLAAVAPARNTDVPVTPKDPRAATPVTVNAEAWAAPTMFVVPVTRRAPDTVNALAVAAPTNSDVPVTFKEDADTVPSKFVVFVTVNWLTLRPCTKFVVPVTVKLPPTSVLPVDFNVLADNAPAKVAVLETSKLPLTTAPLDTINVPPMAD
jgi:hypothetical protein